MKIFISGGTGFVGGHLIRELLSRGHEPRLLVHRRAPAVKGVEQIEGDVTRRESFQESVRGCQAIINLVGIIREFPSRGITFERLHVQATANMLAAAKNAGIGRYLQMSALGTRKDARTEYHRSKFRAEELVRNSGLAWTILRPSLIYGPGDSFINMLAGQLRHSPVMPVMGNGRYRLQPIHADDVARCFALSLEREDTIGDCFDLCGDDRLTYLELLDTVAEAMGKPAPLKPHAPLGLMKLIVPIMQHIPQFPLTSDQLRMLLEGSICDGEWQIKFGFKPRDFKGGIREYLGKNNQQT
jgi:NADH dehydrogenase